MADLSKTGPVSAAPESEPPQRELTEAAKRALAEADERRRAREKSTGPTGQKEVGGRKGPDPVRYGDWEKDGIVSDF